MNNSPGVGSDEFEQLLLWLDRDREAAGRVYEQIRLRLIKIFHARNCHIAEELADETIDRVTKKAPDLVNSYQGDPLLYFYAVARNVHLEFTRRPKTVEIPEYLSVSDPPADFNEAYYECLKSCLQRLDSEQRDLILSYFPSGRESKSKGRENLAARLNVSAETLRMRVYRTRQKLQSCVRRCTASKNGG